MSDPCERSASPSSGGAKDEAERRFRASERNLRDILENLPTGVVQVALDGALLYSNRHAQVTLGIVPEQLERRAVDDFRGATFCEDGSVLAVEDYPVSRCLREKTRQGPEVIGVERRDGSISWAVYTAIPLFGACGELTSVLVNLDDITTQKILEAELRDARDSAEAANRAKSQFLANMSHEMRTPLHGMLGTARILSETSLEAPQRHLVESLRASGRLLASFVDDILDFAKLEAGKLELDLAELAVRATVEEIVSAHELMARKKGLVLTMLVDDAVPSVIVGDRRRLSQVLGNLIGNGIKFTNEGFVDVCVRPVATACAGTRLRFEVRDSGVGIANDALTSIFEPFVQLDPGPARARGGAGLGLAIARDIVHGMDGDIGVTSTPGKGSTFWFEISSSAGDTPLPGSAVQRCRVLAVGCDADTIAKLEHAIGPGGACVSVANAPSAIERVVARTEHFDCAFAAMTMPGMDGPSFIRVLAAGLDVDLPVILLSESFGSDACLHASEFGAADGLALPAREFEICESIAHALEHRSKRHRERPAGGPSRTTRRAAKRILLVEDNDVNAEVTTHMLSSIGHAVDRASDGQKAIERFSARSYDVVLMDCQMPGMDGWETARRMRASEHANRRTPIIAMTAYATPDDRARCRDAGMDDHLAKPFDTEDLEARVDAWAHAGGAMPREGAASAPPWHRPPARSPSPPPNERDLHDFANEVLARILRIQRAIRHGVADTLAQDCRAIADFARRLDEREMEDRAIALESCAPMGHPDETRSAFEALRAECNRVREAIARSLGR